MKKGKIKVILLHAPLGNYIFGDKWQENKSLSPPLGLLYLGSSLQRGGFDVTFLDLNIEHFSKKEFLVFIRKFEIFLITCYNDTIRNVERIIQIIRYVNIKAIILCGGPYCNTVQEFIQGSNLTCVGEAEGYITQILESIILNKSINSIPGLIYEHNGKQIRNPGIMMTEHLDKSPPPDWKLARRERYGFIGNFHLKIAMIMSSRGCPFQCRYCTHITKNDRYRMRSIKNIIEEIKYLVNLGYKYFFFGDDNFLLNKKRVYTLMNSIIRHRLKIKMWVQGRVDSADANLFRKMKDAGVMLIFFGLESANQDVLDYYNKKTTVDRGVEAITLANEVGLISGGFFIIGAPFETVEHFKMNKRFFDRVPLDLMQCYILSYSTGSQLWHDAVQEGILQKNDHHVLASKKTSNFSTEELIEIRQSLIKHFYFNPLRIGRLYRKGLRLGEYGLFLKSPFLFKAGITRLFNYGSGKRKLFSSTS